ncbi:hypothetical protein [Streptomyces sp. NBC_00145]|uniref:hypothetical protein n=1 Tax=Streptomyces sp. NBC_00145 TaxID=2975666 RepID=UPI002E191CAD
MFAGPVTPLTVAVKDPASIFHAVGLDSFTGREWLITEIDAWLDRQDSGYLWIESQAGLGKTTIAAWLVRHRGWFSHFARYTQGSSTRVALQNIAGQLIRAYGLEGFAPGGLLPEWAHTPAGFEALLTAAGMCSREAGRSLVIIVDGVDEAECTDDGLPWGLPPVLPPGVRIIGTYRTGSGHATAPDDCFLRIEPLGRHNISDVRAYLDRALAGSEILARLSAAGADSKVVADSLVRRTGGVWVYLRYVLRQIADGQQGVGGLDNLPDGLQAYYAGEIAGWRPKPEWDAVGSRLLATLVAAGEPLEPESLARLSGIDDVGAVRRWCDGALRPFLSVSQAPVRSYELYHASAREFFGGEASTNAVAQDRMLALVAELKADTTAAHRCISDYFLDSYGTVADGLPWLARDPSLGGLEGGYALRHLSAHLLAAQLPERLHALLTAQVSRGPYAAENIWFMAHDHAGTTDAYLDDVVRAQRAAEHATDEALKRHRSAPAFVHELRYAWVRASIRTLTDQIQPRLLERLVATGVWASERGLAHARRTSDSFQKARALLALHPHVEAGLRDNLVEEALRAARERSTRTHFSLLDYQVESPAMVLPLVSPDRRAALAHELLQELEQQELFDASARAEFMGELIEHLDESLRPAAARRTWQAATSPARGIVFVHAVVGAVTRALPWLTPEERALAVSDALVLARGETFAADQVAAFAELLPHLEGAPREIVRRDAVERARTNEHRQLLPQLLAVLLPHVSEGEGQEVFHEAWEAVRELPHGPARESAIIRLLPHMEEGRRHTEVCRLLAEPDLNYTTLDQVATWLTAAQLREAMCRVRLSDVQVRVEQLVPLVDVLPNDRRQRACDHIVGLARSAPSGPKRALALATVVPLLGEEHRRAVVAEALQHSENMHNPMDELRALDLLVSYVDADAEESVICRAFSAWSALDRPTFGLMPLTQFPRRFPQALMAQALNEIDLGPFASDNLAALSPYLNQENLAHALDIARHRPDPLDRANAIVALAGALSPAQLQIARADLLALGPDESGYAMPRIVKFLPPEVRAHAAIEAAGIARASRYTHTFPDAVAALCPYLGEDRDHLIAEALDRMRERPAHERRHVCSALLPALAEPARREMAAEIVELSHPTREDSYGGVPAGFIEQFTTDWVDDLLLGGDHRPLPVAYLSADCGAGHDGLLRFARLSRRSAPWAELVSLLSIAETVLFRFADHLDDPHSVFDAVDDVLTWWP